MSSCTAFSISKERQDSALQTLLRRAELAACIERHALQEGLFRTAIPRLSLIRVHHVDHPVHALSEPALCMLAQGSKRLSLGGESYVYDPGTYLLVSQHLPVSGQVLDASPERPYLALRLDYDINELASLIAGTGMKGPSSRQPPPRGIMTAEVQPALLDPVLRLVRLLDSPEDIEALAPLTIREILYRLLAGPCGAQLAQFTLTDSASHRVARAIDWLREHYNEPLELDTMAGMVHLSASTLRAHFKAATAMSPMQYQKNLRLQEARRMLIAERLDAATACHKVGYGSASQFSREYSRMFGAPPARDVRRFREHQRGEGLPPPVV